MRSESVCLPPSEASTVQALMDLALPRFAGLGDGPHQVHLPWSVSSDSGCMSSGYKWTRGLMFSGGPGAGVVAMSQSG